MNNQLSVSDVAPMVYGVLYAIFPDAPDTLEQARQYLDHVQQSTPNDEMFYAAERIAVALNNLKRADIAIPALDGSHCKLSDNVEARATIQVECERAISNANAAATIAGISDQAEFMQTVRRVGANV